VDDKSHPKTIESISCPNHPEIGLRSGQPNFHHWVNRKGQNFDNWSRFIEFDLLGGEAEIGRLFFIENFDRFESNLHIFYRV
jgi:hypothetical protein